MESLLRQIVLAVVGLGAINSATGEPSTGLFRDVQGSLAPSVAAALNDGHRLAHIDFERLVDVRRSVLAGAPARALLNLAVGIEYDLLVDRTARTWNGYSLSGTLVRGGETTLVVNGDLVVGTVWAPSGLYDIRTVDGVQVIREADILSLPPLAEPLTRGHPALPRPLMQATGESQDTDDGSIVDLLVLWTPEAAKKVGGVQNTKALIDLGVASANDALARSGVDFRLSLAGIEETGMPDWGGIDQSSVVDDPEAHDEEMERHWAEALAIRDRVGADIVSFVMIMGPIGGLAIQMYELSPTFEEIAFNFVHVDRLPYRVLAHEIGHNMGLHHDRVAAPEGAAFPYGHGYVNQRAFDPHARHDACWRTIMAYPNQCISGGHRLSPLVPYFSNPNLRHPIDGQPLGVDESSEFTDGRGPANAVASLNKARHVVANFRPESSRLQSARF